MGLVGYQFAIRERKMNRLIAAVLWGLDALHHIQVDSHMSLDRMMIDEARTSLKTFNDIKILGMAELIANNDPPSDELPHAGLPMQFRRIAKTRNQLAQQSDFVVNFYEQIRNLRACYNDAPNEVPNHLYTLAHLLGWHTNGVNLGDMHECTRNLVYAMEINRRFGIRHASDIEAGLLQEYSDAKAYSVFFGLPVSLNKKQFYQGQLDFKQVADYVHRLKEKPLEIFH